MSTVDDGASVTVRLPEMGERAPPLPPLPSSPSRERSSPDAVEEAEASSAELLAPREPDALGCGVMLPETDASVAENEVAEAMLRDGEGEGDAAGEPICNGEARRATTVSALTKKRAKVDDKKMAFIKQRERGEAWKKKALTAAILPPHQHVLWCRPWPCIRAGQTENPQSTTEPNERRTHHHHHHEMIPLPFFFLFPCSVSDRAKKKKGGGKREVFKSKIE
jgi:hypothetical protein